MKSEKKNENLRFKNRLSMVSYMLKGSMGYFAFAIVFVFFLALFELIYPRLIGYTVDMVVNNLSSIPDFVMKWVDRIGGRDYLMDHLYLLSIIVIIIGLLSALSRYGFKVFNSRGAEGLVKRIRTQVYNHIMALPYSWFDQNKTGDIIQRCTSDVDTIKNFLSQQLVTVCRLGVLVIMALFFMMTTNLKLSIIVIVTIPISFGYSMFFHGKIGKHFMKADEEEGKLSAVAQENLTGVRVVRAFGRERYERDRFEKMNEEYTKLWIKVMKLMGTYWSTTDLVFYTETMLITSIGAYLSVKGEMTAGNFVAFLSYNAMVTWPVRQLGRVISEMSKADVSIDRIMYIMNSPEEVDREGAGDYPGHGDIEFKNVNFAYESEDPEKKRILKDINMTIKKGQTVGILGGTGSGKSTLIHLLDGVYDLPENGGEITINGVNIKDIKKSELRENIGMVMQEPYLFSRTLKENLKIARDHASNNEVQKVVTIASLEGTIDKFKEGYDTMVGERGVTLSGGQKQRTAIAQMLLRKPDIMVFDDSLSAVDAETDADIRAKLKKNVGEATVILISHRISTLIHADMIYVLDKGRLIEQGTHEELVNMNGRYRRVYDIQTGSVESEVV